MLFPLSQEMALFKSISRASCTSLTSHPCTNPGSQQSVIHESHGSSLMEEGTWVDPRMERGLCCSRTSLRQLWWSLI